MIAVSLYHKGVRCLLPSHQADTVATEHADVDELSLWPPPAQESAPTGRQRFVRVRVGNQDLALGCDDIQLLEIPDTPVSELSPIVRALIGTPAVVGLVSIGDELIWLLDITRHGTIPTNAVDGEERG